MSLKDMFNNAFMLFTILYHAKKKLGGIDCTPGIALFLYTVKSPGTRDSIPEPYFNLPNPTFLFHRFSLVLGMSSMSGQYPELY